MRQSSLRQVRTRRLPPEGGAAGAERQYAAYGAARHSSGDVRDGGRCKSSGRVIRTRADRLQTPIRHSRASLALDAAHSPRSRRGCRGWVSLRRWAAAASAQKERTATAGKRRRARALKIGCCRTWCSRRSSPTRGRRKSSSSSPRRSSRARTSSFTWRDRMLAPAPVAPWPRDRELQPGHPSRSLGAGVSPGAAATAVASG